MVQLVKVVLEAQVAGVVDQLMVLAQTYLVVRLTYVPLVQRV